MKDLHDFMIKAGEEELNELGKNVAEVIFKKVKGISNSEITVKAALLKDVFMDSFDLHFEKKYLDAVTNLNYENK